MYDSRLEMAAGWVWDQRMRFRKPGEPVVDPFCQQPEDVTGPVERELTEAIRAVDTYDSVRDIVRVDMRLVEDHVMRLYRTMDNENVQTISPERLKELEGSVKIFLHHLRIQGDAPYDR